MKKRFLWLVIFWMAASLPAWAAYENFHPADEKQNALEVSGRGFANLVGMPAEIVTTMMRETTIHPHAWPVSYAPRLITNVLIRSFSGLNDAVIFPWVAPFADDTSSWATGMGLPEYPWQAE